MDIFLDVFSFFSLLYLLYNSVRGRFLKCRFGGEEIQVPTDEVREAFRRAALAEVSRLKGGRRINFGKVGWEGNTLIVEEEQKE